jgi:hypothetical protein
MDTLCRAEPVANAENGTSAISPSLGSAQGLSLGDLLLRQAIAMESLCQRLDMLISQNSVLLDMVAPSDEDDDDLDGPRYLSGKSR